MKAVLVSLLLFPLLLKAQNILPGANTILVKGVSFQEVCNKVLDFGYSIEKKDNDLSTLRTEPKEYPKYWNGTYILNIRVKDSVAYLSGTFTLAGGELWKDVPLSNHTNRKGETHPKSNAGYPFLLMNDLAKSFNKPVEYLKR